MFLLFCWWLFSFRATSCNEICSQSGGIPRTQSISFLLSRTNSAGLWILCVAVRVAYYPLRVSWFTERWNKCFSAVFLCVLMASAVGVHLEGQGGWSKSQNLHAHWNISGAVVQQRWIQVESTSLRSYLALAVGHSDLAGSCSVWNMCHSAQSWKSSSQSIILNHSV